MIVIPDALFLFLFFTMCNMFFPTCSCRRSKFSDLFSFLLNTCCLLFACECFRSRPVSCLPMSTCTYEYQQCVQRFFCSHLQLVVMLPDPKKQCPCTQKILAGALFTEKVDTRFFTFLRRRSFMSKPKYSYINYIFTTSAPI